MQQEVGIAKHYFTDEVEQYTALRDADIVPMLKSAEVFLDVFCQLVIIGILLFGILAQQRPFDGLWVDAAIAVGDVSNKHIAVFQRQFQGALLNRIPPIEDGSRLMELFHFFRYQRHGT